MNRPLLAKWRERVRPGDTIISLGDAAHPDAWRHENLMAELRACPGERILMLGNHDVEAINQVRPFEVEARTTALYAAGDPPRQLNYRPARLSDVRRLARCLVEGREVPGHSRRARLNVVERVMP